LKLYSSLQKNLGATCLAFFCVAALAHCKKSSQKAQAALVQPEVTWEGQAPTTYAFEDSAGLRIHHFAFLGADTLSLTLREFPAEYGAYAEFQKKATANEIAEGFYRDGNALFFQHAKYWGDAQYSRPELITRHFLEKNLVFTGQELFPVPEMFKSFPLLERIPKSERVWTADFLGRKWRGPVFSVAYQCHGDTAMAFRAFPQPKDSVKMWMRPWQGKIDTAGWRHEIHFSGQNEFQEPLIFWFFQEGIVGFKGCIDADLSQDYVEKLKKMTFLVENP
jgi:hypothetical protein